MSVDRGLSILGEPMLAAECSRRDICGSENVSATYLGYLISDPYLMPLKKISAHESMAVMCMRCTA